MADGTSIEWSDASWNPLIGCSRVSDGCRNCYAERLVHRGLAEQHRGLTRLRGDGPGWTGEVRFVPEKLHEPLRWAKPRRIFPTSLSDPWHDNVSDDTIDRLLAIAALTPRHTYQFLTKRAERLRDYMNEPGRRSAIAEACDRIAFEIESLPQLRGVRMPENVERCEDEAHPYHFKIRFPWPLPNVWCGVSCENQEAADERVPLLLQTPAAVRFVSAEPLLGPIDFTPWLYGALRLDWIIAGGES